MCTKLLCVPNSIFLSMAVIMQNTLEKADLQKTKVNHETKKGLCRQILNSYWERMKAIGPWSQLVIMML